MTYRVNAKADVDAAAVNFCIAGGEQRAGTMVDDAIITRRKTWAGFSSNAVTSVHLQCEHPASKLARLAQRHCICCATHEVVVAFGVNAA